MILATKHDKNNLDEYSTLNNVQFRSNADIICVQCRNRMSFVEGKEADSIKSTGIGEK